ncbi:ankyrin, partial [Schizophyllum commune Tattone D]
ALLRSLLSRGAEVNAHAGSWRTPLHDAVRERRVELIEVMLEAGANPHARDILGRTPLFGLAFLQTMSQSHEDSARHWAIARMLIEKGALMSPTDGYGENVHTQMALCAFRTMPYTAAIRLLGELGVDLRARDSDGYTLLHYMAGDQHVDTYQPAVASLIDEGHVDIHACDDTSSTPLHEAVRYRNINAVPLKQENMGLLAMLLERGINVNHQDLEGQTPLHCAISRAIGKQMAAKQQLRSLIEPERWRYVVPIVKDLIANGADISIRDRHQRTMLHLAAKYNGGYCEEIVQFLVSLGVDVNARDCDGRTALHVAGMVPRGEPMVQTLLCVGADPSICDDAGRTP